MSSPRRSSRTMSSENEGYTPIKPSNSARSTSLDAEHEEILEAIVAAATEEDNVNVDCWGAMEFAIVNDLPDILHLKSNKEQNIRTAMAFTFYGLNLAIQGGLLWFIFKLLMMPSFKDAQSLYRLFHEHAFEKGDFIQENFEDFTEQKQGKLCNIALSHYSITFALLFLWICTNMREFFTTLERFARIWSFPRLPAGCGTEYMVRDIYETPSKEFWCICLNLPTKVFLNFFNYLPKMLIAIILAFMGSVWLLSAESFVDLILNSLALEFVTLVDELLASTFFPTCFTTDCLAPFRYKYKKPAGRNTEEGETSYRVSLYWCAFLKCGLALGIVWAIIANQQVIPGYEYDLASSCSKFFEEQWPWCSPFQKDCFPVG